MNNVTNADRSEPTQPCHVGCDNCLADLCTESSHVLCGRERAVLLDGLTLCGDCGERTERITVEPVVAPRRARFYSARAIAAGIALGMFVGLVGCQGHIPPVEVTRTDGGGADAAPADAELPVVVGKTGGIVVGGAR